MKANVNESGSITENSHGVNNVRISDSNIGIILSLFLILEVVIGLGLYLFLSQQLDASDRRFDSYKQEISVEMSQINDNMQVLTNLYTRR